MKISARDGEANELFKRSVTKFILQFAPKPKTREYLGYTSDSCLVSINTYNDWHTADEYVVTKSMRSKTQYYIWMPNSRQTILKHDPALFQGLLKWD